MTTLVSLLGCTSDRYVHLHLLKPDETGVAIRCEWHNGTFVPGKCIVDDTRVTIEKETLEMLLQQLDRYERDEFARRHL